MLLLREGAAPADPLFHREIRLLRSFALPFDPAMVTLDLNNGHGTYECKSYPRSVGDIQFANSPVELCRYFHLRANTIAINAPIDHAAGGVGTADKSCGIVIASNSRAEL